MTGTFFIMFGVFTKTLPSIYHLVNKPTESSHRHPEEQYFKPRPCNVIIISMGRVGVGAYDMFTEKHGYTVFGIDYSPSTVKKQKSVGPDVHQEDITDPDLWSRVPHNTADKILVVLVIPCMDTKLSTVKIFKTKGYQGRIAAVALFDDQVQTLQETRIDISFNLLW